MRNIPVRSAGFLVASDAERGIQAFWPRPMHHHRPVLLSLFIIHPPKADVTDMLERLRGRVRQVVVQPPLRTAAVLGWPTLMLRHRGLNECPQLFGAGVLNPVKLTWRPAF